MQDPFREELIALLPRLRRFARGLARSVEDGDDLVQAACERALLRRDRWTPGTRLDSWMYRIIQNLWLNQRAAARVRAGTGADDPDTLSGSDGVRATENRLTLDAVRQAFARLSEEHRVVLLLACVEGFTYKEVAETLGIPTGTVMSRLARARLALYREIEPARGDPGDNVIKMG